MQTADHSLGIIPLSLSKLCDRFAYYGMRSILLLYMVQQISFDETKASTVYQFFIFAVGVLPIVGGLLGDLLFSGKTIAIIGGFIQAVGFFILALPSQSGIYMGLSLIALGTGLYSPNILSTIGSLYRSRTEKLDAAMLILYVTINIGAFLGSFLVALTSDHFGYRIGFIICGIIMTGSQLILLFSNTLLKDAPKTSNLHHQEKKTNTNNALRVIIIIATILFIAFFWLIYEISNSPIFHRISEIEFFFPSFYSFFYSVSTLSLILTGIILIVIYSFVNMSSLLKIAIGFMIYALSCAMIGVYCQNEISNVFLVIIFSAVFLQSVAELFISPTALSIICRYGPAKFNSTLLGTHLAISSIFSYFISGIIVKYGDLHPTMAILISIGSLIFFAIGFLALYIITKEKK